MGWVSRGIPRRRGLGFRVSGAVLAMNTVDLAVEQHRQASRVSAMALKLERLAKT